MINSYLIKLLLLLVINKIYHNGATLQLASMPAATGFGLGYGKRKDFVNNAVGRYGAMLPVEAILPTYKFPG